MRFVRIYKIRYINLKRHINNASDILLIDIRRLMMCAGKPHRRNAISTSVKLDVLFESVPLGARFICVEYAVMYANRNGTKALLPTIQLNSVPNTVLVKIPNKIHVKVISPRLFVSLSFPSCTRTLEVASLVTF